MQKPHIMPKPHNVNQHHITRMKHNKQHKINVYRHFMWNDGAISKEKWMLNSFKLVNIIENFKANKYNFIQHTHTHWAGGKRETHIHTKSQFMRINTVKNFTHSRLMKLSTHSTLTTIPSNILSINNRTTFKSKYLYSAQICQRIYWSFFFLSLVKNIVLDSRKSNGAFFVDGVVVFFCVLFSYSVQYLSINKYRIFPANLMIAAWYCG